MTYNPNSSISLPTLFTPTITSVTPGNNSAYYVLLSPKLIYVYGSFSAGSPQASSPLTGVPVGTINVTKASGLGVPATAVGFWTQIKAGASIASNNTNPTNAWGVNTGVIYCDGSSGNLKFTNGGTIGGGWFNGTAFNANVLWTAGSFVSYWYICPLN